MKNYYSLVAIILSLLSGTQIMSQVIVNEYSCANLKNFTDNYGKTEDWIELYNPSDEPINVSGYYLSDKEHKPLKWKIPNVDDAVIPAKGFLTFWCSKRDTVVSGHFHTNFSLKQTKEKKERVIFSDENGEIINNLKIPRHQLEHSVGRINDGSNDWCIFASPTPNSTNNYSQAFEYAPKAIFNKEPGFYITRVTVTISGNENFQTIRYTTDGTDPDITSPIYTEPLNIDETTVLKARIFGNSVGVLPGFMAYATYFVNVNHILPVISISGNNLKDLANAIESYIRPHGTFEYFEDFKKITSADGEFNKHGQDSWVCDQRSLDFIARDEQGDNHALLSELFHLSDRDEFQRIILRASGDDNYPCGHNYSNEGSAHMRDGFIQNLTRKGDLRLDVRLSERNVVYLNGEYWGVYEIRENVDDHDFTDYYYNQGKYDIQAISTWGETWAEYGGEQALIDWQSCYNFIVNNDMTVQENYDSVKSMYNYKSLVDYVLVNSFTVCTDWLNYNVGWWRGLDPDGDHKKWGYTLWDNDATFAFYINYTGLPDTSANALPCNPEELTGWSDPEGHIVILNKLMENDDFMQYYVGRQADLLNTTFSSEYMLAYFDEYKAIIEPEMQKHAQRWYGTYEEWDANTLRLRSFIERRARALETGISECYNLSGPYDLTVNSNYPNHTKIRVNSIKIDEFPWTGKYYEGMDTKLKSYANDKDKHDFINWSSNFHDFSPDNTSREVVISLTAIDTVKAQFEQLVGIGEQKSNNQISVYPTVVTSMVNVDYKIEKPGIASFDLFDISGKYITQLTPQINHNSTGLYSVKFDFSNTNLKAGSYFIRSFTNNTYNTNQIVYIK